MVTAVGCRPKKSVAGGVGATFKLAWAGEVERGDDGACNSDLCQVGRFIGLIGGFGVTCGLGVEPDWPMRSWIGRVDPGGRRFERVLGGLLGEAAEASFF